MRTRKLLALRYVTMKLQINKYKLCGGGGSLYMRLYRLMCYRIFRRVQRNKGERKKIPSLVFIFQLYLLFGAFVYAHFNNKIILRVLVADRGVSNRHYCTEHTIYETI